MLKLLIADGSEEFSMALADALRGTCQLRICPNGKEVLSILRDDTPDVLLLDLMLPELDGISLLQQAAADNICPMVLATSRFFNSYVLETLDELGVGYVMRKPCDVNATVARLMDLSQRIRTPVKLQTDPRNAVSTLLLDMGIQPRLKGYACLREAVLLMAEDPGRSITKEVYPNVAKRLGGNKEQVEHVIRSSIQKAWTKRDIQVWAAYFPSNCSSGKCPTNKEFICRLSDVLGLSQPR